MSPYMKLTLLALWLFILPTGIGRFLLFKRKDHPLVELYLIGQIFVLAFLEITSMPVIFFKLPLHYLSFLFALLSIVLGIIGWIKIIIDSSVKIKSMFFSIKEISIFQYIGYLSISCLMVPAVIFTHFDADDSFFIGTSATSLFTDSLFKFNPYTGKLYTVLPSRYILSPFPGYAAILSQLSGKLHVAIIVHVFYVIAFMFMAGAMYILYSKLIFPDQKKYQGLFLIFCTFVISLSGFSIYNSEVFYLTRIWQGKSILATIIIPFILYLILVNLYTDMDYPWYILLGAVFAGTYVSSMGIILIPIEVGAFVVMAIFQRIYNEKLAHLLYCFLPCIAFGLAYLAIYYTS